MRFIFHHVSLLLLLTVTAIAADLKIGSLNCYLLFDPSIEHRGKVDGANRMTAEQYRTKVANLSTLTKGYQLVALQETGGREEVTALANAVGVSWAYRPTAALVENEASFAFAALHRAMGRIACRSGISFLAE